jgi:hypothetical protein
MRSRGIVLGLGSVEPESGAGRPASLPGSSLVETDPVSWREPAAWAPIGAQKNSTSVVPVAAAANASDFMTNPPERRDCFDDSATGVAGIMGRNEQSAIVFGTPPEVASQLRHPTRVWQHRNNIVEGFIKRYGVHFLKSGVRVDFSCLFE